MAIIGGGGVLGVDASESTTLDLITNGAGFIVTLDCRLLVFSFVLLRIEPLGGFVCDLGGTNDALLVGDFSLLDVAGVSKLAMLFLDFFSAC